MSGNAVALTIFIILFVIVTLVGFAAARWRQAEDRLHLDEWGLGGRWLRHLDHLVPARRRPLHRLHLHRRAGRDVRRRARSASSPCPTRSCVYPIIFVFMPRLWSVSPPARLRHAGRLRARPVRLARAVAGRRGHRHPRDDALHRPAAGRHPGRARGRRARRRRQRHRQDLPLFIAFAVLAAYTYSAGCARRPLIAFVKDTLIYVVIIVAVIYLPDQARRLDAHLRHRGRSTKMAHDQPDRPASRSASFIPGADRSTGPTPPSPWARRWRCSCTRTR